MSIMLLPQWQCFDFYTILGHPNKQKKYCKNVFQKYINHKFGSIIVVLFPLGTTRSLSNSPAWLMVLKHGWITESDIYQDAWCLVKAKSEIDSDSGQSKHDLFAVKWKELPYYSWFTLNVQEFIAKCHGINIYTIYGTGRGNASVCDVTRCNALWTEMSSLNGPFKSLFP